MQAQAPRRSVALLSADGQWLASDREILPAYSITKMFIAAMVLDAEINLHAPASNWIDASWLPEAEKVSVHHLLTHTSGIRDYGTLPEYGAAIQSGNLWSDDDFADYTLRQPLLFEPGSAFAYSNAGYWLLGEILQRHSDRPFEALMQSLLDNLALSDTRLATGVFTDDLPWYPADWVWHRLLMTTAQDVVTFLRSAYIPPMRQVSLPVPAHPLWDKPRYSYGLMEEPGRCFGHNGGGPRYTASGFHFLESGLTGCVLLQDEGDEAAMRELHQLVDYRTAVSDNA